MLKGFLKVWYNMVMKKKEKRESGYDHLMRITIAREKAGIALRDDLKSIIDYGKEAKHYIAMQIAENLDEMVKSMIRKSIDGDVNAFTALLDRAHGKPAQALGVFTDPNEKPIVFMPLELIQKHALEVQREENKVNSVEAKTVEK